MQNDLIDIHAQYTADIVSTTLSFPSGRQRIETKIHFEAINQTNPPGGQITIFGYQVMDQLAGLDVAATTLAVLGWGAMLCWRRRVTSTTLKRELTHSSTSACCQNVVTPEVCSS